MYITGELFGLRLSGQIEQKNKSQINKRSGDLIEVNKFHNNLSLEN